MHTGQELELGKRADKRPGPFACIDEAIAAILAKSKQLRDTISELASELLVVF